MAEKKIYLQIPFPSTDIASLACNVLNVDKELKGSGVTRVISVEDSCLIINFYGSDLKRLRVCVNAILKQILLISKTVEQFPSKLDLIK